MNRTAPTLAAIGGVWGIFLLPRVHPALQAAGTILLATAVALHAAAYIRTRRTR